MIRDLVPAALMSLEVSLVATVLAATLGIPLGAALEAFRFRGRDGLVIIANTLMATPTVLIGLLVYWTLSRRGPLGVLEMLYTPGAMIAGETLLALPLVIALTRAAVETVDPLARETARTLRLGRVRTVSLLVREARPGITAAVLSAYGRVVSELGIALMVGGNVRGETRTLTTAMTLATQRGDFQSATALGLVLLVLALGVVLIAEILRRVRA